MKKPSKRNSNAWAISDRSGMKFPMREMIKEPGTGFFIHKSESDGKYNAVDHPQANLSKYLRNKVGDPFPVLDAHPDRNWALDAIRSYNASVNTGMIMLVPKAVPGAIRKGEASLSLSFIVDEADGRRYQYSDADLEIDATVSAVGLDARLASSSLSIEVDVTSAGIRAKYGNASLESFFTLTAASLDVKFGSSDMEIAASVAATGIRAKYGLVDMEADATLTSSGLGSYKGVVAMNAAVTVTVVLPDWLPADWDSSDWFTA